MGKSAVQLDVPDAVSGRMAEAETEVIDNAGAVAENNANRKKQSSFRFAFSINAEYQSVRRSIALWAIEIRCFSPPERLAPPSPMTVL